MWLKLDLDGIIFQLQIKDYRLSSKITRHSRWCKTDFSFISGDWLNYSKQNDEVFLSCEIEELASNLDKLLKDELSKVTKIQCIEPDFKFLLHPKKDLRNDPKYTYIQKGYEIQDFFIELIVTFWHDGLTNNYLSVEFDRDDIHYLFNYLNLIMGNIDKQSKEIDEMLMKGIIYF